MPNCPGAELSWFRNVSHRCRIVPVPKCLAFVCGNNRCHKSGVIILTLNMVKSHFSFISCADIVQVFQSKSEFLKFVGPKGQIFGRSDRNIILGSPIVRQTFFCCFVRNGFAKHVPWLLISCLTDCLCNLGSKYNCRICPGFINSKSGKQSYPQSFCNIIVDWWD